LGPRWARETRELVGDCRNPRNRFRIKRGDVPETPTPSPTKGKAESLRKKVNSGTLEGKKPKNSHLENTLSRRNKLNTRGKISPQGFRTTTLMERDSIGGGGEKKPDLVPLGKSGEKGEKTSGSSSVPHDKLENPKQPRNR